VTYFRDDPDSDLRGDLGAREILRVTARKRHKRPSDESASLSAEARSDFRRQVWRAPLRMILGGAVSAVGAYVLITTYPKNSAPALLTVELIGLFVGPLIFVVGLVWLVKVVRRGRQVGLRQWVAVPARAAVMRYGPLSRTVVALEITPKATLVIYPEEWFRSRIRRLVEHEGQLLVLLPRPEKIFAPLLYAGPNGSPAFAENRALAADPARFGELRGLAALAHRIEPS
jgi:hypothetical protein